jgi:glycosyltransferase involved in cell wall biosynthesis
MPKPTLPSSSADIENEEPVLPTHHLQENGNASSYSSQRKPFVSLVVPAYNEAKDIQSNLALLCRHMKSLEAEYCWELIVINDGSRDETGNLIEDFARGHCNVRVIHHLYNEGLGQALRTGFEHSSGDYIITLDSDLSYSPDHIERLLSKIRETGAKVVVASPYMKGGKVSNVPWLRKVLSIWANRFLCLAAKRNLTTLTGMVRVYDTEFIRSLNLNSSGMEINPEILHKAKLLEARVTEIPAHLKWREEPQPKKKKGRRSSMKILKHTWAVVFFGFLFRPVMFFIIPSMFFFGLSVYANAWVLMHTWTNYQRLSLHHLHPDPTEAVAAAFQQAPHTFIIGGMTLMLAIQLFSLGILSVQSKRYFEEVFYLGTEIYKSTRRGKQGRM